MSRWVEWRGTSLPRGLFDPPLDLKPGTCPRCGGLGVVPERIDEEKYDVAFPCQDCRMFCKTCRKWVKRAGHKCEAA